jgi:hypothetical protein
LHNVICFQVGRFAFEKKKDILIFLDTKEDDYLRGTTGSKVSGMATYSQMSDRSSATKIISKFILFSIFYFFLAESFLNFLLYSLLLFNVCLLGQ